MKFLLSNILLIFLIISCVWINKDEFVFKKHEYDRKFTVYINDDNRNNQPIIIKQGTLFRDLLNELGYSLNARYIYGLNEPLYDEEYIDLSCTTSNRVSINKGTADELDSLPGIGPATVNRIIEYRETYGNFNYLEELKNVSGIGDKKFEKLKELVCL